MHREVRRLRELQVSKATQYLGGVEDEEAPTSAGASETALVPKPQKRPRARDPVVNAHIKSCAHCGRVGHNVTTCPSREEPAVTRGEREKLKG